MQKIIIVHPRVTVTATMQVQLNLLTGDSFGRIIITINEAVLSFNHREVVFF